MHFISYDLLPSSAPSDFIFYIDTDLYNLLLVSSLVNLVKALLFSYHVFQAAFVVAALPVVGTGFTTQF